MIKLRYLLVGLLAGLLVFGIFCGHHNNPRYVDVVVCAKSGLLPTKYCELVEEGQFIEGTEPTTYCTECTYEECDFEVQDIHKIIGWSAAYHSLTHEWDEDRHFTFEEWDTLANYQAKYTNATRFFAYCSEKQYYLDHSYIPFPKIGGKYDVTKLDDEYVEEIGKRLRSFHKRKLTTIITLFTSIKGGRFEYCPFNGSRNINETTEDVKAFITDSVTRIASRAYVRNMVREFDNEYIIWELINEPNFKPGKYADWCRMIVQVLIEEGVCYERIMVPYGGMGSQYFYFSDLGVWSAAHSTNSLETVIRAHTRKERWNLWEDKATGRVRNRTFSGDGGNNVGVAKGLKGWESKGVFRKASSKQMYQMLKFDLTHGKVPVPWTLTSGNGIEFMSLSPFAFPGKTKCPNYADAIKCAVEGLTQEECDLLGVDYEENRRGELKALYQAVKDSNILEEK